MRKQTAPEQLKKSNLKGNTLRKAIFPVAGLGTRFLPATKAHPKEMLPIVDKPLIQYAVEEAVAAGITQLIFITSLGKRSIEDHFDSNYELESRLEARGNLELLKVVRDIVPRHVGCVYIRQSYPLGLGHAVLCAKHIIGNEPFAVLLADDLIDGTSCIQQMLPIYEKHQRSVIAVEGVPLADISKYGIVKVVAQQDGLNLIEAIIEKPEPHVAPSNLAAVGRYLFTPQIFHFLENVKAGKGGEIQLTDAIAQMLTTESIYAHHLQGKRFDCGSKLGYVKATIAYSLKHPEIAADFKKHLQNYLSSEEMV